MSYLYAAKNLVVKLFSKRPIVKNVQIVQLQTSHILEGRTALITGSFRLFQTDTSCPCYRQEPKLSLRAVMKNA